MDSDSIESASLESSAALAEYFYTLFDFFYCQLADFSLCHRALNSSWCNIRDILQSACIVRHSESLCSAARRCECRYLGALIVDRLGQLGEHRDKAVVIESCGPWIWVDRIDLSVALHLMCSDQRSTTLSSLDIIVDLCPVDHAVRRCEVCLGRRHQNVVSELHLSDLSRCE